MVYPPKGEDCLYQIDESLNKDVRKQMLDLLDCSETEYSWPNKTFNNLTCLEARDKAISDAWKPRLNKKNAASKIGLLAWYNIALLAGVFGFAFNLS
jgi:hypothetical protein